MGKAKNQYVHFDALRGLAALAVCLGHIRGLLLVDYPQVEAKGAIISGLYFLTGLGHQAVMVFFVLSGFFISRTIINSSEKGTWTWRRYGTMRLLRLWIVLVPALFLTLWWDYLGLSFSGVASLYHGDHQLNPVTRDVAKNLGFTTFIGNLFFVQTILTPPLGTNGPLWSLANEFWYYLIFPLGYCLFCVKQSLAGKFSQFVLLTAILIFLPSWLLTGLAIWLLGVGVYFLSRREEWLRVAKRPICQATSGLLFVAALFSSRVGFIPGTASDFAVGISCALFLITLLKPQYNYHSTYRKVAGFISATSYTLYLVHLPFSIFIASVILKCYRWQPSWRGLAIYTTFCGVVLVYSYVIYLLFEAHTEKARAWIFSKNNSDPIGNFSGATAKTEV